MAAGAAAIGAAFYFHTPGCLTTPATLEGYSSEGGDPILFDSSGNRLTTPVMRETGFRGPGRCEQHHARRHSVRTNTQVSTPASTTAPSPAATQPILPEFPRHFSGRAPHPAATAALMLQANPALTPTQIISALQSTALTMPPRATSASGYNYDAGHGFVQIDAALTALPASAPTISISPTSITVGSSATLTWNAINSSGCTASGSWSGSQSASGSQTVTPTATGTDTYTLACTGTDGSMSSSATLTVNAVSSSGGGQGGRLDELTLLALGGILLARRVVPRARPPSPATRGEFGSCRWPIMPSAITFLW